MTKHVYSNHLWEFLITAAHSHRLYNQQVSFLTKAIWGIHEFKPSLILSQGIVFIATDILENMKLWCCYTVSPLAFRRKKY